MFAARKLNWIDQLHELIPISGFDGARVQELAQKVAPEDIAKGGVIFSEGDTDNAAVYVLSGKIEIYDQQRDVDTVLGGSDAARYALAHHFPRTLGARAKSAVTIIRIPPALIEFGTQSNPDNEYQVDEIALDQEDDSADWMTRMLQSQLFQLLPAASLQQVMMRMEAVAVSEGQCVLRAGDEAEYFYLIKNGVCASVDPDSDVPPNLSNADYCIGDTFGSEALILAQAYQRNYVMCSSGVLLRLGRKDFDDLICKEAASGINLNVARSRVESGWLWLDVRSPELYGAGHQDESINLPFAEADFDFASLDLGARYIAYCDDGTQSAAACFRLAEAGIEAAFLIGGWRKMETTSGGLDLLMSPVAGSDEFQSSDESPLDMPVMEMPAAEFTPEPAPVAAMPSTEGIRDEGVEARQQEHQAELDSLKRQHHAAVSDSAQVRAKLKEIKEERDVWSVELAQKEQQTHELTAQMSELTESRHALEEQAESYARQIDDLHEQLDQYQAAHAATQERFEDREKQVRELEERLAAAQSDHRDQFGEQAESIGALEQELQQALAAGDQGKVELAELQKADSDKAERLTQMGSELEQQTGEVATLREQIAAVNDDRVSLSSGMDATNTELKNLREELASVELAAVEQRAFRTAEIEALSAQVASAGEANDSAKQQLDAALTTVEQDRDAAQREYDALQSDRDEVTHARDEAVTQCQQFEQDLSKMTTTVAAWKGRVDTLETELRHGDTELDSLRAEFQEMDHGQSELAQRLQQSEGDKMELSAQLNAQAEQMDALQGQLRESSMVQVETVQANRELQEQAVVDKAALADKDEALSESQARIAELGQDLAERDRALGETERDLSVIQSNDAEALEKLESLAASVSQLSEIRDALNADLAAQVEQTDAANTCADESEQRYQAIERQVANDAEAYAASITELQQSVASVQQELDQSLQNRQAAQQDSSDQIDQLQSQCESLSGDLAAQVEQTDAANARADASEQRNEATADQAADDADAYNTSMAELQQVLAGVREELDSSRQQVQGAENDSRDQINQLQARCDSLTTDLEQYAGTRANMTQLEVDLGEYKQRVTDGEIRLTDAERSSEASAAQLVTVSDERDSAVAGMTKMEKQMTELRGVMQQYLEAAKDTDDQDALRAELDMVRTQAEEEIARLHAQLKQLQK
ncbi:MAG TPA: hypothetical protein EYN01_03935 [Chromatiales bacterium]|nr:hypothetical protein [Chromatiales bacterium]